MDGRHQAEDSLAVMAVHGQIGNLPNRLCRKSFYSACDWFGRGSDTGSIIKE